MFLALSWYAVDGRKWFKGPRINIEHVEGTDADLGGHSPSSDERPANVHEKSG